MNAAEIVERYIQGGLQVLPLHKMHGGRCSCGRPSGSGPQDCASPAKHPLTHHGKDDATTDPGQVAEWLAKWPGCNWGIRPPVGVIVLDIDPRNGGDETLAALQREHGELPATLTARTGSGGLHIWFSYNGPARGKLGAGIDVKSNSGYLVAPPSVHECGGTYEWIDERPAAWAPIWVREILNPPTRIRVGTSLGRGGLDGLIRFVLAASEGERNRSFHWACCRAVEGGHELDRLIEAALQVGLTAVEAEATARSAKNAPPHPLHSGRRAS